MKKKIIIGAMLLLAVALAVLFVLRRPPSAKDRLHLSGTIEITDVELSFKIPGRVAARLVDEGERVDVSQVVARLDDTELRQELEVRQREVAAQEATLAELKAGSRPEEIAQAEAALMRAKAESERAAADNKRMGELLRRGVIANREYEAVRASHEVAQAREQEAAEQLRLVRIGPRQERIDFARARLQESRGAMAQAKSRLDYATLTSPLAGVVLAKNIEPGEQVAAGTPVVTVGDLNDTWLRAYIAETDLGRVKVGQQATITSDTYPGKIYHGMVTFIAQTAEFTPKNVQTEKERVKLVYRIKISIPNPAMELKPGMPADAVIQLSGK
ncbi:MAG TPA: efflux RND transporter periplasmic adaptor subunit [Geobacterales bacterium]|nr:efflux RND transporter periplasmic adaptor subunit [Geobacterales bacterium]